MHISSPSLPVPWSVPPSLAACHCLAPPAYPSRCNGMLLKPMHVPAGTLTCFCYLDTTLLTNAGQTMSGTSKKLGAGRLCATDQDSVHAIQVSTDRCSMCSCRMQTGQELGRGANAGALAASHPYLPCILLKHRCLDDLESEAQQVWLAAHPHLAPFHGEFSQPRWTLATNGR